MQIDYALILSAGLGTRMGKIGKLIPKVMWPIMGIPLIDLQISYCQRLGIKKIFINTHYLAEVLESHLIKKYGSEIVILHEDPLLDSGGAIHNMAMHSEVNYQGNVLMVNGDQFFLFDDIWFEKALAKLKDHRACLFGIKVDKDDSYNETKIENELLVSIDKNTNQYDFVTYSGLGLLKLDGLQKHPGISKFFTTVANFKSEKIAMVVPDENEYWDFGTLSIYAKNILKIFKQIKNYKRLQSFLNENNIREESFNNYVSIDLNSIRHNLDSAFVENEVVRDSISEKF